MTELVYFKYIILLSKFLSIIKLCKPLSFKYVESAKDKQFKIIELSGPLPLIRIQSPYRVSRFLRGFRHAGQRQWNRYNISQLLGNEIPDVFIDIGANIGELSYYASTLGIKKIIAVEPDPVVCEILKFNLRDTSAIICEKAVSLQEGSVSFFSAPYTADSSLIEPTTNAKKVSVKSISLKSLLSELDIGLNVLLKIDAEGYEPEILQSGIGALEGIKYLSVDVSPERGGTSTDNAVESILNKHHFYVNRIQGKIVTARRKELK